VGDRALSFEPITWRQPPTLVGQTPNRPPRPEAVRVLGVSMPVLVRSEDEDCYLDGKHGYIDHSRGRIILNARRAALAEAPETVLHEILHGLEVATATPLTEEVVTRISRGLYAVLRDNPELVRWLMEGAE
jgi:hypothetical protein